MTGNLATFGSVNTPILAPLRSAAGSWEIMLEKSWPTSRVAWAPNRRLEAAIWIGGEV
jgi:hypothetical protein